MLLPLILASVAPVQAAMPQLPPDQTTRRLEPSRILLKTHDWDSRLQAQPALPPALSYHQGDADQAGYWFIQGQPDQMGDLRGLVVAAGGMVFDYLPHNGFEIRLPAGAAAFLAQDPSVQNLIPVHPGFKVDPQLGRLGTGAEDLLGRPEIAVEFWPDQDLLDMVDRLTALELQVTDQTGSGRYLRAAVRLPLDRLVEVARLPGVKWLEETGRGTFRNDKSQWVVQTNQNNNTKLWDLGLLGNNVTIGHIDGRIDENACYFNDPSGVSPGPSHRKIKWWNGGGGGDSHGTHTAASAAGNNLPTGGNGNYNGLAPEAFLVHHAGFPGSTQLLTYLNRAHSHGARIHTNSWGNDGTTSYNNWCRDIDAYSRDEEDGVVMFAETNGNLLKNPENAKSCVAVGATSRNNPSNHGTGGRGPTSDGRWKPEVYAPGCSTFSASRGTNCSVQTMCGTSMASPVVAGSAALVKQYFEDGYYPSGSANAADGFIPTGSLLRGMLANCSVDMTGVSQYPSHTEGWGRLLLDNAVFLAGDNRRMRMVDFAHAQGIRHGQTRRLSLNIPAGSAEMRVTLCFADEPGAAFSNQPVVNDLNLIAIAPDGTQYAGNILNRNNGGAATPNPTTQDAKNTLEQIIIKNPQSGRWTFMVEGKDVPVGPQGFAGILTY